MRITFCFRLVSTHSRPKAAGIAYLFLCLSDSVSTHSRPKAAGADVPQPSNRQQSFNTQPPEGGWAMVITNRSSICCFNTQPPEGGWNYGVKMVTDFCRFNTQPPEGGWSTKRLFVSRLQVSTHSRPKAAGQNWLTFIRRRGFQHTAARRRLENFITIPNFP